MRRPAEYCCRRCDRRRLSGEASLQAHRQWADSGDRRASWIASGVIAVLLVSAGLTVWLVLRTGGAA